MNGREYLPWRHFGRGGGWGEEGCLGGRVRLGTGGGLAGSCAGTAKLLMPGGGAGGGTPGGNAGGGYVGGPLVGVTVPGSGLGGCKRDSGSWGDRAGFMQLIRGTLGVVALDDSFFSVPAAT
jgi:hypothetical protein